MAVKHIPDGYHSVTPYLIVRDLRKMLAFVQQAFGAKVVEGAADASGNVRHGDVLIGDSHVMMGQGSDQWAARPADLYLYVEDTDATYHRALAAGATSVMEPEDKFYGDRNAGVEDPQGNHWWIGTHIEDVSEEELAKRAAAAWK